MNLSNYIDLDKLEQFIEEGLISRKKHSTLPLYILNYTKAVHGFWPHEICACRGLIVDENNDIVSRPQYKFFNLGQTSTVMFPLNHQVGTLRDSIPTDIMVDSAYLLNESLYWHSPLTITRKMDGQMGVLWNYGDQWGVATRGSFESEGSVFATEKFQKFVKYGAAKDFIPKGWTLIFEIVAKHLRIVIPYDWEGLCLLTAVNNETGEEMSYTDLHELWTNLNSYSKTIDANGNSVSGKPWCRIVEKFDMALEKAAADEDKEEEGYVCAVNRPGLHPIKVKIKLAEYCRLHRVLTNLTPQMLWSELALPMDPLLTVESRTDFKTGEIVHSLQVPPEFRAWVLQWQRGLTNAFHEHLSNAMAAERMLLNAPSDLKNDSERKKWLLSVQEWSRPIADAAMQLNNGDIVRAYAGLWHLVRPHGRDEKFFIEGQGE
jgi:RNA ligase